MAPKQRKASAKKVYDYSGLSEGTSLQAECDGVYYSASVVQVSTAKNRSKAPVKVSYKGWSGYDEWVGGDRLRSKALTVSAPSTPPTSLPTEGEISIKRVARVYRAKVADEAAALKFDAIVNEVHGQLSMARNDKAKGYVKMIRTVCKTEWAYECSVVWRSFDEFSAYKDSEFCKEVSGVAEEKMKAIITGDLYSGVRVYDELAFGGRSGLPEKRPSQPEKRISIGDFNSNIADDEIYKPPDEISAGAHCKSFKEYTQMYRQSLDEPEKFWGDMAKNNFYWQTPFKKVGPVYNYHKSKGPISIKWFIGGKTNISYNCLDKQIKDGNGNKVAMLYECNDVDDKASRAFTYQEIHDLVCQIANSLKASGVKKGDRVTVYLPMSVELPAVMLACARIGAIHSVVFGGFSDSALAGRICDATSTIVITADAVMRGAKPVQLKAITDAACKLAAEAAEDATKVTKVVCVKRLTGTDKANQVKHDWVDGRDVWFDDFIKGAATTCECEWMDSEDPLFMLYTSGSTGKPKGVVHTTAGYMIGAWLTSKYTFDLQKNDIWFCTADCGWITGHTYIAYGPMMNGATQVVFEGVPTWPDAGRFWAICEKYKVTSFYTAPTALRALMKSGEKFVEAHDLSSLRILGTVGEPINPEAWRWYYNVVGQGRCPIMDTYWQTETGGHLITSLPGAIPCKPGSAGLPFFGVEPEILGEKGEILNGPCAGRLVISKPTPSMMRTVFGDHKRFEETYFSQYDGYYFPGDGCKRDKDGFYWITGRMDDVINVSGHRIGTAEVESALVAHTKVAEAAVVGYPEPVKGQGIYAYVTLKEGVQATPELLVEVQAKVREIIGPFAKPDIIHWAPALPKTRSGKIMRRILRKLAMPSYMTEDLGDVQTLADPSVVEALKDNHPYKK